MAHLSLIAAVAQNGAIGHNNTLIYHLPADLKHFKQLTTGHTIIMGRRTFESLPNGALPQRRNIVLSRTLKACAGVEVFTSLHEALQHCEAEEEVFIIGGAAVYQEGLSLANSMYLTHIDDTPKEADVFFPAYSDEQWECIAEEYHTKDERHAHDYTFATYQRK